MTLLRSVAFVLFMILWTLVLGLILAPVPVRIARPASRLWARSLLAAHRFLVGATHEIRGVENLPREGGLIAAKHQSAFETVAFLALLPRPIHVLKRELLKIPIYGWHVAKLGHIPVDRAAGAAAMRVILRAAKDAHDSGGTLIIFPEGTRMPPGEHRTYHSGVVGLQETLGVPITPVALNSGMSWKKGLTGHRPGRIILEILAPIPAGLGRRDLLDRLKTTISEATDRLEAEAAGSGPAD